MHPPTRSPTQLTLAGFEHGDGPRAAEANNAVPALDTTAASCPFSTPCNLGEALAGARSEP